MIVKMKKYVFLVYHKHYTDFLEKLRKVGVLHVAEKAEGIADNDQLRDKMQLSAKIKKTLTEATPFLLPNTTPQEVSTYEGAELLKTWDALQAEKNRLQQVIAATQKEAER
ncbi:MAG TPA: V-type ATP synthase subunit I, partial [Paludibacteraceae bacterium]|nr:V-type ATP synthase subunit I [Paludibacteraceae bacterium]